MATACTAFRETSRTLRTQLREARLDHLAFEARLRPCDLATCRATCCHDGAVLSEEEAATIRELLALHPRAFANASLSDPEAAVVASDGALKTGTRPAAAGENASDFPSHFPPTRCVFLDPHHKCTLQLLSLALGHHPWFYKPISCWMHPVLLRPGPDRAARPTLTLRTPDFDPARFASCTHCGRPDPEGLPARSVLAAELRALSDLADRDFGAELNAPALHPPSPPTPPTET